MIKNYLNKHNFFLIGTTILSMVLILVFLMPETTNHALTGLMTVQSQASSSNAVLHFFWGDGCPYCTTQKVFLEQLAIDYPELEIIRHETWNDADNYALFQEYAAAYGVDARGVPATFMGNKSWIGFNAAMGNEITAYVIYCLENSCEALI